MVILSNSAKEKVLSVTFDEAYNYFTTHKDWFMNQMLYLSTHAKTCYTIVYGQSPTLMGLFDSGFDKICGLDPFHVFTTDPSMVRFLKDQPVDFSEDTLNALYQFDKERMDCALINRSLEMMSPEQSRGALIGLHKRLVSRGRVLVVLERSLCVKEHLELLDEAYFEQLINPYFMMESIEEISVEALRYKVYKMRAI